MNDSHPTTCPALPNIKKQPVVFLLAVWGKSYIENFFEFSLPSLLAPGNIPALSKEYTCTFLFLTKQEDISFFKAQASFEQLSLHASVEFIEISDLIFGGSYSATLTLAYERGMRSQSERMCETYFFFLVSDYIMADGSLGNMSRYLKAGYNGITTGNFLVVEEYVSPILKKLIHDSKSHVLSLNSKEMLKLAFPYLHPVSIAQSVTQFHTHATHANRLFWKVNDHTMVGRFYLRHMLCIKPEIDNYIIGASCDYSFIPEMCPSGNVVHIQDSDEYCLIEMAPYNYEELWIKDGPFTKQFLANKLSEWTTHVHRANAHVPVIYHSKELLEPPISAIEESEKYIQELEKSLTPKPQPVRGHHYWISCVRDILNNILQEENREKYYRQASFAGIIGSPTFSKALGNETDDRFILKISKPLPLVLSQKGLRKLRLKEFFVGTSPDSKLWHLHWFEDKQVKLELKKTLENRRECVVLAFEPIRNILEWIEHHYPQQCVYQYYDFFTKRTNPELQKIFQDKERVLIWASEEDICKLATVVRECAKYLKRESSIHVYLKYKSPASFKKMKQKLAISLADLVHSKIFCEKRTFHFSIARFYLQRAHMRYIAKLFAPKKNFKKRLKGFVVLSFFTPICLFCNVLNFFGFSTKKKSTFMTLVFKKES